MTWLEHEARANRPPGSTTASAAHTSFWYAAGPRACALARREARRVDDHEVPLRRLRFGAREELERVDGDALVTPRRASPTSSRFLLERRRSRAPRCRPMSRASRHRARRAARTRPCTQNTLSTRRAGGVPADRAAVVALIEEEPGLLAARARRRANRASSSLITISRRRIAAQRFARAAFAALAAQPDVRDRRAAALEAASTSSMRGAPERARPRRRRTRRPRCRRT